VLTVDRSIMYGSYLVRSQDSPGDSNLKRTASSSTLLGLAAILIGCGGSSGSSSNNNSGPPVCTALQPLHSYQVPVSGGGSGRFVIPYTSIENKGPGQHRFHTNHLISTRFTTGPCGSPEGITPKMMHTAYGVPMNGGSGAIAVVDAYDYPNSLVDLNAFSSEFGLPTESSSNPTASTNTVFQVVYAAGKPTADGGWSQEAALDTQWAHAMAPKAKIYLVEAASDTVGDLMNAVSVAASLPGVKQVSISSGAAEDGTSEYSAYDNYFVQPGVSFFVAAGDNPNTQDFPAESAYVIAVGGTTLDVSPTGVWQNETVWNGTSQDGQALATSCGPSKYEARPAFQNGIANIVGAFRGAVDIAADADPDTGVPVFDSYAYQGASGWMVFGGTSAATPITAGIANTAGVAVSSQAENTRLYAGIGGPNFHNITTGSAGSYAAGVGWNYPTGVGTPKGVGGF
jgi:subtilase family serine protease